MRGGREAEAGGRGGRNMEGVAIEEGTRMGGGGGAGTEEGNERVKAEEGERKDEREPGR